VALSLQLFIRIGGLQRARGEREHPLAPSRRNMNSGVASYLKKEEEDIDYSRYRVNSSRSSWRGCSVGGISHGIKNANSSALLIRRGCKREQRGSNRAAAHRRKIRDRLSVVSRSQAKKKLASGGYLASNL